MRRWRCPQAAKWLNAKSWIELLLRLRVYVPNDTELLLALNLSRNQGFFKPVGTGLAPRLFSAAS
jgi:hypothetical protein